MSLTKDGFYKSFSGAIGNNNYLLEAGGGHIGWGNAANQIPYSNGTVNTSLNADMTDGLHVHSGRNNEANKIVRTDGSGYIQAGWINTTSGDMGTTAIDRIYCSNDGYIRYKTKANFAYELRDSGYLDGRYLRLSGGTMNSNAQIVVGTINNSSGQVYSGGIQLREYQYQTSSVTDNYENAPGITFHWGGRWVHKLNMHSNALYWDNSRIWNSSDTYVSGGKGYIGGTEITQVNNSDTVDSYHANRFAFTYNSANYGSSSGVTMTQLVTNGVSNASHGMIYPSTDNPTGTNKWVHVWSQQWTIGSTSSWVSQIALGVQDGTGMWYRTTSGNIVGRAWIRVLDSSNYTTYVNNYYWANIKVSTTSQTNTTPQLGGLYVINDSSNNGYDGLGYFRAYTNNDWGLIVDKSQSYTYGIDIRAGGGYALRVGNGNTRLIGATIIGADATPAETLDVRGIIRSTGSGVYVRIGPQNSSHAHYETNAGTSHWFNKRVDVNGAIWRYGTNYGIADDGNFYAYAVYANRSGSSTAGGVSLYSTSDPITEYGIAFRGTGSYGKFGRVQGDWATYLTMDSSSNRGWIFRSGGTNYASISARGEAYYSSIGRDYYIAYPNGGQSVGNGSSVTGAIAIYLPTTTFKCCTMLKFTIEIYEYSGSCSTTYTVAGYNYSDSQWYNTTAYSLRQGTNGKGNLRVRFGDDGSTRNIIWIGETNTTWSYPQVYIKDITLGHSGYDYNRWAAGWSIGFVTSFGNVRTYIDNPAINYIADYATYPNNILVYQHTANNTDYPLIWSNQNNTGSNWGQQLHKSYAELVYNPANKEIKTWSFAPQGENTNRGIHFPGGAWINSISTSIIFRNSIIRFGTSGWDWNQWAGLSFNGSDTIAIGMPDNSYFTANSVKTNGTIRTVNSKIEVYPNGNSSWGEGIRIHSASNGWTTLILCGTDNTGFSGTSANSWSLHTYVGNFYLNKQGSSDAKTTRMWGHGNGYTFGAATRQSANVTVTTWLEVTGSTNATMSSGTTNPRITFSENGGQAVGLVYTDYDSYRASKGLKVMDVDGNDSGNVWLEIQGKTYGPGFVHTSYNSATYLLRSDGGAAAFNWSGQSGQPTWIWGGNSQHNYYVYNPSNFVVQGATWAHYLLPHYDGGDKPNPQTYFNQDIGVKVAMTRYTTIAGTTSWCDTLWINGYTGGDVPNMNALTFFRNGTPRFFIHSQSNRATSYGTYYEVATKYNTYKSSGYGYLFNDPINKLYPIASNPDNSHPGYGCQIFYSWNTGNTNSSSSGWSNGITIGSHPSDQAYGFQIVQNMWDDNTYTRRYNSGWQSWRVLLNDSNYPNYCDSRYYRHYGTSNLNPNYGNGDLYHGYGTGMSTQHGIETGGWYHIWSSGWSDNSNWISQIAIPTTDYWATASAWYRTIHGSNYTWRRILDQRNYRASYGTTGGTSYIQIKINSTTSWMLSFKVRVYQSYQHYDIVFSGYNYGGNYWYSPQVRMASSTNTSITCYFGYDSAWNLWVGIPGASYTGVEIVECVNGYSQTGKVPGDLFTISNVSSFSGTVQSTQTAYAPWSMQNRPYWANIQVSNSSSTSTSPTFSTCYTSNWFRSTGSTGWYSESYGGGIWMTDSTWIRTYNSKGMVATCFYATNWGSATYLLRSDGGAAAFNWSGQSGQPTWIWGGNSQHNYYVYNPSNFSVNYANYAGYAHKLDIYGTTTDGLSFYQTSGSYMNSEASWAHYIISNHGNGATYYNYTIRLPFWGIPQYQRMVGNTSSYSGWHNFITDENISSQYVYSATNLLPENTPHYFRDPNNSSWRGGLFWGSAGGESMSFVTVNGSTRFQFVCGSDIAGWSSSTWQNVTPSLQVCSGGVLIGGGGSSNPSYKLHVLGDIYANGGWLRTSGNTGWYSESYGGGWWMTDSTWIKNYNNKALYMYTSGSNSGSDPIARFMQGWDCGNRAGYDTVVISSNDCTGLRLIESDGTCTGISAGNGKSVIATTHYLQFYTGASSTTPIYYGMGGTEVVRISSQKLTMFAGQQNKDYSISGSNVIDLTNYTTWVPSSITYKYSSGRCVLFFPIPSAELLGSIIYIHRIYIGDWLGTVRNPSYPSMNNAETIWNNAETYCHSTAYIMGSRGNELRWMAESGSYKDNAVFYRCEYDYRLSRYFWREHWTGGNE